MDGRILRRGIISSYRSASTSEIVKKALLVTISRVSSAIASTRPLPFLPFTFICYWLPHVCMVASSDEAKHFVYSRGGAGAP